MAMNDQFDQTTTATRDEDPQGSNRSGNPHLQDMIDARVSRRGFLGGTVAVAASFFGGSMVAPAMAHSSRGRGPRGHFDFLEGPPSSEDTVVVPPGYTWE